VQYGFAQLAHPLWTAAPAGATLSATQAAALVTQHQGVTVLAMLLGGIVAMISTLAMSETTPREQAITLIGAPIPLLGTLAGAIALSTHRTVGIAVLAVVMESAPTRGS
jgi:hypothetical protein